MSEILVSPTLVRRADGNYGLCLQSVEHQHGWLDQLTDNFVEVTTQALRIVEKADLDESPSESEDQTVVIIPGNNINENERRLDFVLDTARASNFRVPPVEILCRLAILGKLGLHDSGLKSLIVMHKPVVQEPVGGTYGTITTSSDNGNTLVGASFAHPNPWYHSSSGFVFLDKE